MRVRLDQTSSSLLYYYIIALYWINTYLHVYWQTRMLPNRVGHMPFLMHFNVFKQAFMNRLHVHFIFNAPQCLISVFSYINVKLSSFVALNSLFHIPIFTWILISNKLCLIIQVTCFAVCCVNFLINFDARSCTQCLHCRHLYQLRLHNRLN